MKISKLLKNLNFFDPEKMIPAKEESKKMLRTIKMQINIIFVSFCSKISDRISEISPDAEVNVRKNNDAVLRFS